MSRIEGVEREDHDDGEAGVAIATYGSAQIVATFEVLLLLQLRQHLVN